MGCIMLLNAFADTIHLLNIFFFRKYFFENYQTLEQALIKSFVSRPHPLCFTAPPTDINEFKEIQRRREHELFTQGTKIVGIQTIEEGGWVPISNLGPFQSSMIFVVNWVRVTTGNVEGSYDIRLLACNPST